MRKKVRVLSHSGCPLNTQDWFLSVGNPEQYDFLISEDWETLVVEPNTPRLTSNFEFIHCAEGADVRGKHVKCSAKINTQDVFQIAQLHLRGENSQQEKVFSKETKIQGTYD